MYTMKINYFSRIVSILLLSLLVTSLSAKDIWLSEAGDDGNGGTSESDAVASVTKAFELLADGDVIKVVGFIDITQDPMFNKKIDNSNVVASDGTGVFIPTNNRGWSFTIDGGDRATSGFDGKDYTGRFGNEFAGYNSGTTVTIKNVTFKNCGKANLGGGSVLRFVNNSSSMVLENCDFTTNMGNQGSIYSYNTNLTVKNCNFYENNDVKEAAAIFADNKRTVIVDGCSIYDNDRSTVSGSQAGAIISNNVDEFIIKNSVIKNNKVQGSSGAIMVRVQGALTESAGKMSVENTLIAYNEAANGSALHVNNTIANYAVQVSLINSTIYGNRSTGYGALYFYQAREGSTLDMINTTVVENYSNGNAGHGPGMRFESLNADNSASDNIIKRIYNCIIENNSARETAGNPGDIILQTEAQDGVNMFLRNSYVSYILNNRIPDKPEYNNSINYVYNPTGASGLAWPSADYIAERGCVPLDFESPALAKGDAQYLQDLGISTDQEGNTRLFTDGKCAIGAVEPSVVAGVIEGEEHDYTHYIIYGQSLSTGHDSDPLSTTNVAGNYMLGDRVWVNNGNATLNDLNPLVATLTAGPQAEAPIHGMVNHLRNKIPLVAGDGGKENRFLATSAGTSGKPIEELSKEYLGTNNYLYANYEAAIKKGKSMALRRGSTITCPAIVFMQGEWNYQQYGFALDGVTLPTNKKDEYKALMLTLKDNMQADVKAEYGQEEAPIFYTYQVGVQYTKGYSLEIGMAQLEAANENDDIICVGPVYQMTDNGGHLDANGYRWYGEMIGKVIYKTQVLGEKFSPLQPMTISRVADNPKQVLVKYQVPKPPLVLDTKTLLEMPNYGFNLYLNDSRKNITSVEVTGDDNNYILITSDTDLTGKIAISYAGEAATLTGYNLRGHGNVRDSDDYEAFFEYEEKTWTKPTTSGEPKDEDGNIIYGKKYPLYNFSVSYYYEVPAGNDKLEILPDDTEDGIGNEIISEKAFLQQIGSELYLTVLDNGNVKLDIYNISGGLVKSYTQDIATAGTQKYSLESLSQGMYVAKANVGNNVYSTKVLIK